MVKKLSPAVINFIISVVVGFLAGAMAYLSFGSGLIVIPYVSQWYLNRQYAEKGLVITQPRKVVVEQDLQMTQVNTKLQKSVVGIYSQKSGSNILEQFYLPNEKLAEALTVTVDGWLVTAKTDLLNKKLVVIDADRKVLPVQQVVENKNLGLSFLKVSGSNFAAAGFAPAENLTVGQSVAILSSQGQAAVTAVQDNFYRGGQTLVALTGQTEKISSRIKLANGLEQGGGIVANYNGEVVGLVIDGQNNLALASEVVSAALTQILKQGALTQPYLGLDYIDLRDVPNGALAVAYGAVVRGIAAASPAKNILQVGDVILAVNDDVLRVIDLGVALQAYQPGDQVELKILRQGNEQSVIVKLAVSK